MINLITVLFKRLYRLFYPSAVRSVILVGGPADGITLIVDPDLLNLTVGPHDRFSDDGELIVDGFYRRTERLVDDFLVFEFEEANSN